MDLHPLSLLSGAVCWLPLQSVRLLRRIQTRGTAVVRVALGNEPHAPSTSIASEQAKLQVLQAVAADPRVRGVVVDVRRVSVGWAGLQALRKALRGVQRAGKLVVTHLDGLTTRELYLASVADHVWLTPSGEAFLQPVGAHLNFYGDALKHLGVVVDMEAAGTYKSFGEPFTRSHPSRANREQTTALVADLQAQLLAGIAKSRGLEPEAVAEILARSPLSAEEAVACGLVDAMAYPDEARQKLEELLGAEPRRVSFGGYARWARWERRLRALSEPPDHVAVVHLEGSIVEGDGSGGRGGQRIESERVVPALDALRKDSAVRAVVLYVNSPGGSALASDLIARAVRRLVEEKPVVALFGDVSASGGYYLSAPAVEVIASPGTITGSIGVVGGKVAVGPALQRYGVHHERIASGPDTGLFHPWAPLSPDQRARFKRMLSRTYERFLHVVSAGRKLPLAAVREVAEGRVWTGRQALDNGLVDRLGDLDVALERARGMASLGPEHPGVRHHRFPPARYSMLRALVAGAQLPASAEHLLTVAMEAAGPAGRLARMVRAHPLQPLLLLPWQVDPE